MVSEPPLFDVCPGGDAGPPTGRPWRGRRIAARCARLGRPAIALAAGAAGAAVVVPSATTGSGRTTIHDRGLDSLTRSVPSVSPAAVQACGGRACMRIVLPSRGQGAVVIPRVGAGDSAIARLEDVGRLPSPLALAVASSAGQVAVAVVTP
jgi:hypothetical protein